MDASDSNFASTPALALLHTVAEATASSSTGGGAAQQQRQPSSPEESTPHLSDPGTPQYPDTPSVDLRTPGKRMDPDVRVREDGEEGLGFGHVDVVRNKTGDQDEDRDHGRLLATGLPPGPVENEQGTAGRLMISEEARETLELEFPEHDALQAMQARIQRLEKSLDDQENGLLRDALGMLKSLLGPALHRLPFLHEQIQAQRETIQTMQQQTRLSEQLAAVERDRHMAERAGWQAETQALLRQREAEIAAGARPKKLLDLDVGYHQELEAANKRLEMDNRLMAPRLADTQRQIDKLVTELRHLRSHVVLGSQMFGGEASSNDTPAPHMPIPSHLSEQRKSASPFKASASRTTMGDARTEHLLLAARKVRAMRLQDDRIGRVRLDELHRGGVVGPLGGVGYSEGYAGQADLDDEEYDSDVSERRPYTQEQLAGSGKVKGKGQATPLLPRSNKKSAKKPVPQPTTPSRSRHAQPPETTPGGSNFSDLLRAAEMADRPTTPTRTMGRRMSTTAQHAPMSAMSATRSTTMTREETASELGSPVKRHRRPSPAPWETNRQLESDLPDRIGFPSAGGSQSKGDDSQASALDILAQASSLDVAQSQSQPSQAHLGSAQRFGGMLDVPVAQAPSSPRSSTGSTLGPAIDLRLSDPPTPVASQPTIEDHQIDPALTGPSNNQDIPVTATHRQVSTPRNKPRTLSQTSEIHTPARRFSFVTPGHEAPDDTPTSRSEYLGLEPAPGAFASPTGAAVPGLGKYVHLTSTIPARRIRSPYLKWTVEEDELLARAVAMHGEKWDLVSKGVPTRSYHQVRQRWLRKTGAFDKKVSQEHLQSGTPLRDADDDEEETSPTPESRGHGLKKRKMQ